MEIQILLWLKHLKNKKEFNKKFHISPLKLNLGCGNDYKEGWINIDNNSANNIKKLDLK